MSTADPAIVTAMVARNVRSARSRRGWTLDELADRSKVSKGMLVQVEQARTNPSLGTICRMASALGVTVASLVEAAEGPRAQVIRGASATPLWGHADGSLGKLLAGSGTNPSVELWDVRLAPGDGYGSEPHPQGTRELLLAVEGELTLEVEDEKFVAASGDAIVFDGHRAHTYRNLGTGPLRYVLATVHPPRH